jgi:hypothetical protein
MSNQSSSYRRNNTQIASHIIEDDRDLCDALLRSVCFFALFAILVSPANIPKSINEPTSTSAIANLNVTDRDYCPPFTFWDLSGTFRPIYRNKVS